MRKTLVRIDTIGCAMRSRKRIFEVVEKSFAIPSVNVSEGKSIELKAATEPLIPIKKIPKSAIVKNNKTFGCAILKLKGFPPLANHAVKVRKASKIKVFIKCAAIQKGLAAVKVSGVARQNQTRAEQTFDDDENKRADNGKQ